MTVVPVRGSPVTKIGRSICHVGVLRILLPRRLGHQSGDQRVADEEAAHLAAELGQVGVAPVGLEQHAERLAIVVVVGAEVVEAAGLGRRGVQIVDGADVGRAPSGLVLPAVHVEGLAGDPAGQVAGHEQDRRGHLVLGG